MRILKIITGLGMVLALLMASTLAGGSAEAAARKQRRSYYLTNTEHAGDSALTACAAGFHMASLWEIFDTSNLRYDTSLGFTSPDSGSGPPAGLGGWIRTGFIESHDLRFPPGVPNCDVWTSSTTGDAGTQVSLPTIWRPESGGSFPISPWSGDLQLCSSPTRVWCVEGEE